MKGQNIAIIGAGMSGLTLARQLMANNEVTIFEKSRGIGGRMPTRRADKHHFDHGAQFFTAKSDAFKAFCQQAKANGLIDHWDARFVEITGTNITKSWQFGDDNSHYVSLPQMNSLCKNMAKDLDVRLQTQITALEFCGQTWLLKTDDGPIDQSFDYVMLAIPSHQAVQLLPTRFAHFDEVSNVTMQGCFSLMLGFNEKPALAFDAALVKDSIISWISVNSSKPQRPQGFSLLVNSSNAWADAHIEQELDLVKSQMIAALHHIIDFDDNWLTYHNIHRWRYANAALRQGQKSLLDHHLHLGVCGDWLIGGRVENAYISGLDLAAKLKSVKNTD